MHAVPSPVQAGRPPTGAPSRAEHRPTSPGLLQAAHCSPHLALQQTPSTQKSEVHWLFELHGLLLASFARHCPPLQIFSGYAVGVTTAGEQTSPVAARVASAVRRGCARRAIGARATIEALAQPVGIAGPMSPQVTEATQKRQAG